MKYINGISAIDLFCGAGGLTKGLEKSGIKVNLGVDIDPMCEYPYSHNNSASFLKASIDDISKNDLQSHYNKNDLKILAGCAPCQTFSKYNQKSDSSDKRWWLLLEFERIVSEMNPEIITMENVPGLVKQDVFTIFYQRLKNNGYNISYNIVDCSDYGLPQTRKRLVLLASKLGDISLITPKEFSKQTNKTVKDVIGKLPSINAGESHASDKLHKASSLSEINIRRIKASKPGGSWKDWPDELITNCHKKSSGKSYVSVYGRMKWDSPAPTLTTQFTGFGNGRFGHPSQNRAISLREGALLQGFPKGYKFVPPREQAEIGSIARLIGNAVPVTLGKVIGKSILKHMEKHNARQQEL